MGFNISLHLLLLTLSFLVGCSTQQVRLPALDGKSYQFEQAKSCDPKDPFENRAMSALSGFMAGPQLAEQLKRNTDKILRPFTSDGCSMSPDGLPLTEKNQAWIQCCVVHDTHYWMGGTAEQRESADNELGRCIAEKGYKEIGQSFTAAVKYFGGPDSSQTFRWGYGWNYRRPYKPLDQSEISQVAGLYGTDKNEKIQFFQTQPVPLVDACTNYDLAANGFNPEEKTIFDYLNSKLKKNVLIEWAQLTNFNFDKTEYKIKLKDCFEPVTAVLKKRAHHQIELLHNCSLFK